MYGEDEVIFLLYSIYVMNFTSIYQYFGFLTNHEILDNPYLILINYVFKNTPMDLTGQYLID